VGVGDTIEYGELDEGIYLGDAAGGLTAADRPVRQQETVTNSTDPLISYWFSFSDAFIAEIEHTLPADLLAAWGSPTERTQFYTLRVLPAVAQRLGLSHTKELFKVDVAMRRPASNGEMVPVVFIESENDATTAVHEMRKLCALSCPLAVLITVIEWNPDVYGAKAQRDHLTQAWSDIIKAHAEVWQRPGIIGVLIGEWGPDDHLRFYRFAYSMNGRICVQEKIVTDRHVPSESLSP
jgi:hypothetical protein